MSALQMPTDVAELIRWSMTRIGLQPVHDGADALVYDLEYEAGLTISVLLMCVSQHRWFRRPEQLIRVRFVEYDEQSQTMTDHIVRSLTCPMDSNDIRFAVELGSCIRAGGWALAVTLGMGECMSLDARPDQST